MIKWSLIVRNGPFATENHVTVNCNKSVHGDSRSTSRGAYKGGFQELSNPRYRGRSCKTDRSGANKTFLNPLSSESLRQILEEAKIHTALEAKEEVYPFYKISHHSTLDGSAPDNHLNDWLSWWWKWKRSFFLFKLCSMTVSRGGTTVFNVRKGAVIQM